MSDFHDFGLTWKCQKIFPCGCTITSFKFFSKFFQKTLILAFEANNTFVPHKWDQNCVLSIDILLCTIYLVHTLVQLKKGNIRRRMSNSTNFSVHCDKALINWNKHYVIALYIEGLILVLGILINLSGIIVLLIKQKTHQSIFHKLLIFLVLWDLSYLTFNLMIAIKLSQNPNLSCALNMYFFPIRFTLLTGSIYSTIAMTLDRYLSTYLSFILTSKEILIFTFTFQKVYCILSSFCI